uniref:Uncharacterized protein n=1 Tax=Anguilla anguilla TaxID=7936 RepID=A0A0E9XLK1_ANGAN
MAGAIVVLFFGDDLSSVV